LTKLEISFFSTNQIRKETRSNSPKFGGTDIKSGSSGNKKNAGTRKAGPAKWSAEPTTEKKEKS
jgi:hypothetical protein